MNADVSRLLREWPFEPGKINVRVIEGEDGEPRIQMRLDLGLLQMFTEGRPDGQRPRGYESLLEFHEARLDEFLAEQPGAGAGQGGLGSSGGGTGGGNSGAAGGGSGTFSLTPEECRELRDEAVQYYHRYMALLVLEDYEGVVRDTGRNLRVLDLCARHAQTEADRQALEPFRAYITMTRARALASQAIKDNEPKAAINAIDDGLEALRQHFAERGQDAMYEDSSEVRLLRGMREALVPKLPVSQKGELKRRLAEALREENYELAAILRDELRALDA